MKTKFLKVFHPNSKKLDRTIRHINSGPILKATAQVLGVQETELKPLEEAFKALEKLPGAEVISMRLGDRRVRLEQVTQ